MYKKAVSGFGGGFFMSLFSFLFKNPTKILLISAEIFFSPSENVTGVVTLVW